MDTKFARESRMEVYNFLAKYLNLPEMFKSVKELAKAAYRF